MQGVSRCKICGGNTKRLGNYIKCQYCRQVYELNGYMASEEQIYIDALKMQNGNTIEGNLQAKELFESILDYKDSGNKVFDCYDNIADIEVRNEERRLEERRLAEINERERVKKEQKKKEYIKWASVVLLIVIVVCVVTGVVIEKNNAEKREKYFQAIELYENNEYESALRIFSDLNDFESSQGYVSEIENVLAELEVQYNVAIKLYNNGEYVEAFTNFEQISDYEDASTYLSTISKIWYNEVMEMYENEEYEEALTCISNMPEIAECYEKVQEQIIIIHEAIKKQRILASSFTL